MTLLCGDCVADVMNVDPTTVKVDYRRFETKDHIVEALEIMAQQLRLELPYTAVWRDEKDKRVPLRAITVVQGVPLCAYHAADRRWLYGR
jgi:hypothetical protein